MAKKTTTRITMPCLGAAALLILTAACGDDGGKKSDGDGGADDESTSTGPITTAGDKFDVGDGEATNSGGDCPDTGGMPGEYEFSYIWIANSSEGTVSKVNTFTGVEEGRYNTGPGDDDPSRTSVNQFGDVAVANRMGSITKIAAQEEGCVDKNNDNVITTSTGPMDVKAWGEDECMIWHVDLPSDTQQNGARPVAWEPVETENCMGPTPRVWVGWYKGVDEDVGVFRRLDGATGATLDEVEVPNWDFDRTPRPYGGAVNAAGDFWVTGYYGPAIRIDAVTLEVDHFPPLEGSGYYGMAMDVNENIWIGGCDGAIYHFDTVAEQFEQIATIEGRARGVQVDTEGRAWFAGNNPCRLILADTETKTLVNDNIPLPGCGQPVGVSIDIEGYVWVVDMDAEQAYKVDPETHEIVLTVTGLVEPYTYSDMTGAGLGLVANPPQG